MGGEARYTNADIALMLRYLIERINEIAHGNTDIRDEFLRVPEVAELLGMSEPTIRKHIAEGRLRASRPGRYYIVSAHDLSEFLDRYRIR